MLGSGALRVQMVLGTDLRRQANYQRKGEDLPNFDDCLIQLGTKLKTLKFGCRTTI